MAKIADKEKQFKRNLSYFTKWSGLPYLGIAIAALGVAIFLFAQSWWMYFFLPYPLLITGIIICIVGFNTRTSENDFLEALKIRVKQYEDEEIPSELLTRHGKNDETPESFFYSRYVYAKDNTLYKILKNGTPASSIYNTTKLTFLEKGLYCKTVDFSLVEDSEDIETILIDYSDIKDVDVERSEFTVTVGKETVTEKLCYAVLNYSDGKKIYIPHPDDALLADFCTDLKKKVEELKK